MKRVVFYYPSRIMGGAEFLFYRCASYLGSLPSYEVFFVDYKDGFVTNRLKHERNEVQVILYNGEPINLPDDSCVIIQLSMITKISCIFINANSCRFIFWGINPGNLYNKVHVSMMSLFSFYIVNRAERRRIGEILTTYIESGSIRFMDYNNFYTASKTLDLKIADSLIEYIPVPINSANIVSEPSRLRDGKLSLLWLSRLDGDKYNTIATIINEISEMKWDIPYILYVIGVGTHKEKLMQYAAKKEINVQFLGKISDDNLNMFIDESVDVGIAMGTSALDIAKRGKPTIIQGFLSHVYKAGVLCDYLGLHEEFMYNLAKCDIQHPTMAGFSEKLRCILDDYENISRETLQYVRNNHTMEITSVALINAIDHAKFYTNLITDINEVSQIIEKSRGYHFLNIYKTIKSFFCRTNIII